MTHTEIESKVIEIVAECLNYGDNPDINPDDNLKDEHDIDSLGLLQVTLDIEKEYGIQIFDEEMASCHTVREFANIVENKLKNKQ